MGRLIDADALIAYMEEKADETKQLDNIIVAVVCGAVSEQPTAYDVEKVVEELEEEKEIHTNHYNISIYKDFPEIKQRYKQICGVIKKSIDIVKRGGVE